MTTAVNRVTILGSESRGMPSEETVKQIFLKSALLIAITVCALPLLAQQAVGEGKVVVENNEAASKQDTKPTSQKPEMQKTEPARRFTPSEKLRADDAISFPVDI